MAARRLTPSLDESTYPAFRSSTMDPQLTYVIVKQRSSELQHAGMYARLVRDVRVGQRSPRRSSQIARLACFAARFVASGPWRRPRRRRWSSRPPGIQTAAWTRPQAREPDR